MAALSVFTLQNASNFVALGVSNAFPLPAGSSPTTCIVTNLGNETVYVNLITPAASTTATQATVGVSTIVVASASSIAVGQVVIGAGIAGGPVIPAGYLQYPNGVQRTTVVAINGTTITLSAPITAALSSTSVVFVTPVVLGSGLALPQGWSTVPLAIGSNTYIQMVCAALQSSSLVNVAVGV